jgi:cellobiose phosphorylase
MAVLNEKYYSKYKIPPIKSITSALKSIGYSQEFIDSMMVKYKKRNELIEKKWKILEKRFDAPSTASRNKKKKADKKAETEPEPETEVFDDEDLEEETKEDDEPEEDEAIVVDDEGDEEEVVEDDYVSDGGDE